MKNFNETVIIVLVSQLDALGLSGGAKAIAKELGATLLCVRNQKGQIDWRLLFELRRSNYQIISLGLSADLLCSGLSHWVPFVRSDINKQYKIRWGLVIGCLALLLHTFSMLTARKVLAFDRRHVPKILRNRVTISNNFLDVSGCHWRSIEATSKVFDFIFVGALIKRKRLDRVLSLANRLPDKTFMIVGDGPFCDLVRHSSDEMPNVTYYGFSKHEACLSLIAQSKVMLIFSDSEGVSRALMEARTLGLWVVLNEELSVNSLMNDDGIHPVEFQGSYLSLDQIHQLLLMLENPPKKTNSYMTPDLRKKLDDLF